MTKNDTQPKHVFFTQTEMNALAFALKNRLAVIELKAMALHGDTPESFRKYLEGEWEYISLLSITNKLEID